MKYIVVPRQGHYAVYINGTFYCKANSWYEAAQKIDQYQKDWRQGK